MTKKDQIEGYLAILITVTYCFAVAFGRASMEGFVALAVYIVKKYCDGIAEERKNNGGGNAS